MSEQITYYLQENHEPRLIIDSEFNPEYKQLKQVQATSWIQAKYLFGYPLTNLQYNLLDL